MKEPKKIEITEVAKVNITVAGTKLALTVDQVLELRDVLNKTFPIGQGHFWFYPGTDQHPWPLYTPWWQATYTADDNSLSLYCDADAAISA